MFDPFNEYCGDSRDPALQCRCPYSGRTWANRRLAEELDPSCYEISGGTNIVTPITYFSDPVEYLHFVEKERQDILGSTGPVSGPVSGSFLFPVMLVGAAGLILMAIGGKK